MRAWISLAVMAAIAVSLPACKKKDTNTVDDSAYDAIVTAVLRGDAAGAEAAARAHVNIVSDASSEFVHSARRSPVPLA